MCLLERLTRGLLPAAGIFYRRVRESVAVWESRSRGASLDPSLSVRFLSIHSATNTQGRRDRAPCLVSFRDVYFAACGRSETAFAWARAGGLVFLKIETRYLEEMRGAAAVAAILFPACCLGLLVPAALPRTCTSATRRALPCRHGNTGQKTKLSAGRDPQYETASAAEGGGMSTALSRAREVLFEPAFRNCLAPMAAAGAILGPNLDNYHSAFGVLTYKDPIEISLAGHLLVTTDWW